MSSLYCDYSPAPTVVGLADRPCWRIPLSQTEDLPVEPVGLSELARPWIS